MMSDNVKINKPAVKKFIDNDIKHIINNTSFDIKCPNCHRVISVNLKTKKCRYCKIGFDFVDENE